jgi:peptide/nickel transport system substrate-binding protein
MKRLLLALVAALVAGAAAVTPSTGSDVQTPRRGGTAVVALPVGVTCLSVLPNCRAGWPVFQVLEGAFEVGPDLSYRPNLVSRVDVREEPFTLTYRIRPEARWSDGTPVTADDFLFTFKTFLATATKSDPLRKIRRVAALGPRTLRVSFRLPYPGWRELFHEVLPRHALVGEDLTRIWQDRIDNPKTGEPIGSGPFLVERLEPGRQLTLVRNSRYWGPHTAYLERIVFRFVQGDLASLTRGEIDLFFPYTRPDAEGLEAIQQGAIMLRWSPGANWEHFEIQVGAKGHPALKSRLARRALAYGIDREAIVRAIYAPFARGKGPLDSAVFLKQSRFHEPNWSVYRYRPAESRRLLEEAGCRRGPDRIYVCGGRRLSLRFLTTGGIPPRELTLRLVQTQLRRAGVEVVPEYAPSQTVFLKLLVARDFDAFLFAWVGRADSGGIGVHLLCGAPDNYTGYCDRQVTRDLRRSDLIVDPRRRAALLNRIDARLARDVPVLPLYQASHVVALRPILRGVVLTDPPDYLTWNSEDWWLER